MIFLAQIQTHSDTNTDLVDQSMQKQVFFIGFREETLGEKSIGPKMWKKFYSKIIAMISITSKSISFKTLKLNLSYTLEA